MQFSKTISSNILEIEQGNTTNWKAFIQGKLGSKQIEKVNGTARQRLLSWLQQTMDIN